MGKTFNFEEPEIIRMAEALQEKEVELKKQRMKRLRKEHESSVDETLRKYKDLQWDRYKTRPNGTLFCTTCAKGMSATAAIAHEVQHHQKRATYVCPGCKFFGSTHRSEHHQHCTAACIRFLQSQNIGEEEISGSFMEL